MENHELTEAGATARADAAQFPFGRQIVGAFMPHGVDNHMWRVALYGKQDVWLDMGWTSYPIKDLRTIALGNVYFRNMYGIDSLKEKKFLEIVTRLENKYLTHRTPQRRAFWQRLKQKLQIKSYWRFRRSA